MGCASSKQNAVTDLTDLKTQRSKTKSLAIKQLSATRVGESEFGRTSPSRESSDDSSRRPISQGTDGGAWASKRGSKIGADRKEEIEGAKGFGRGGTAMFIPFEPNPAGAPATPSKKKRRSRSGRKAKSRIFSSKKSKADVVFIPGSGTERMLFKSTASPLAALPPLGFHKVGATQSLKEKIAQDRKESKAQRRLAKDVARELRHAMGMRKDSTSQAINQLILGFADLLPQKRVEDQMEEEVLVSKKNHVVIQCGPPVANPAASMRADPWKKRKL